MKKSALLAAALVLCTANAWAYENNAAGFSVKDRQPFYKMESAKLYAFSSFSTDEFDKIAAKNMGSVHIVNYYDTAEMSQILGVPYNDAYFAAEYDKLALLQRSKLDLRTVPSPLLDLKKYALAEGKENLFLQEDLIKQQLGNIEPVLRLDKRGNYKLITQSYLYKQDNTLNELDISLVAANNNLYILTSITSDSTYYAPKTAAKDEKMPAKSSPAPELKSKKLDLKVEAVKFESLPQELSKKLWQEHWQLVKSFKALQPQKAKQTLQFIDSYKGKTIVLPKDWVYGQLQIKEDKAKGCLTMAAPVANLRKIFAEMDYLCLYKHLDAATEAKKASAAKEQEKVASTADIAHKLPELDQKQQEFASTEARKVLKNFDAFLMTLSYQTKDKDFQAMAESALSSKMGADMLLAETLSSLKKSNFENFALESFDYKLNFASEKASAVITGRTKWLKDFSYDNLLQLDLTKNDASFLLYAHKPEISTPGELQKSMRDWQF